MILPVLSATVLRRIVHFLGVRVGLIELKLPCHGTASGLPVPSCLSTWGRGQHPPPRPLTGTHLRDRHGLNLRARTIRASNDRRHQGTEPPMGAGDGLAEGSETPVHRGPLDVCYTGRRHRDADSPSILLRSKPHRRFQWPLDRGPSCLARRPVPR